MSLSRIIGDCLRAVLLALLFLPVVFADETVAPTTAAPAETIFPSEIEMVTGQLRTINVKELERVAVGDAEVADVLIMSDKEVLLQAKKPGSTSLIVWDKEGQHRAQVTVVEQMTSQVVDQLGRLLVQLNFNNVHLKQEGKRLILDGWVQSEDDRDRIEQLLVTYPDVTNLVVVAPEPPPPLKPPPPLIKLQVQLIEMNKNVTDKLGVDWTGSTKFVEQSFAVGPSGEINTNEAISDLGVSLAKRVGEPFRIGRLMRFGFEATLNYLVSQGKARILSQPTLVAASGQEATSFMGTEQPIISATTVGVTTGGVTASIEYHEVGVKLTMTPTLLEEHEKIELKLKAEVSSIADDAAITVDAGTSKVPVPSFKTRGTETQVVTASGETIVISGLVESEDSETVTKVSGLGDIPVIGRLFRLPIVKNTENELVIAVTPELVVDASMAEEKTVAVERALATAEVTSSVNDPRLQYALMIQDRIAKAVRYPQREGELGMEGRVKLKLHLFADGTLGKASVMESSGLEALDVAALKAAESQTPYPSFPSGFSEQDLWIEVPVIFRL